MRLYVDNDVLSKLAQFDLLDELAPAYLASRVVCLDTAKHKFKASRKKNRDKFGTVVLERIHSFLRSCSIPADDEFDDAIVARLSAYENFDQGEAILFACLFRQGGLLLTGDKRCLQAMATLHNEPQLVQLAARKCVCLEQVIQKLIGHCGHELVFAAVHPERAADGALKACFIELNRDRPEALLEALGAYTEHLRGNTGELLIIQV